MKETQGFINKDFSILKKEILDFPSPNQCYEIIIALLKCIYLNKLVSQVGDVVHGPLAQYKFL